MALVAIPDYFRIYLGCRAKVVGIRINLNLGFGGPLAKLGPAKLGEQVPGSNCSRSGRLNPREQGGPTVDLISRALEGWKDPLLERFNTWAKGL